MENSNSEVDIVLMEDNPDDAELTIRALQKNNIANNIILLRDGEEGLDFIYGRGQFAGSSHTKPRLILLDLKMPKVSGLEVLKQLKSDDETSNIPIVILTSSAQDPDVAQSYKLGANSYIVKPVGFENFSKAIAQLGVYWLLLNHPPLK